MIVITKSKLEEYLKKFNIDTDLWGKGRSKTINHLFNEIIRGETELVVDGDKLVREVSALSIIVRYGDKILKEDKQVFNDGRTRKRKMTASVAEKLDKDDNDLISAVKRGIKEELGFDTEENQITHTRDITRYRYSESYPNLFTKIVLFGFKIELNESQYDPNGYIEIQEDKKTYFKWVKD